MSNNQNMARLGKHIAAQHGWPAAKAFKTHAIGDADRAVLSACALDLLRVFPALPDTAAPLGAALAVSLERRMQAPIHVVTGTLAVDGLAVFGGQGEGGSDHAWVMIGATIVDIAIFRAAYAPWGPPRLARHVDLVFGPGKGVYVDQWSRTARHGLAYTPRHVLSAQETDRLMGEAFEIIRQASSS